MLGVGFPREQRQRHTTLFTDRNLAILSRCAAEVKKLACARSSSITGIPDDGFLRPIFLYMESSVRRRSPQNGTLVCGYLVLRLSLEAIHGSQHIARQGWDLMIQVDLL